MSLRRFLMTIIAVLIVLTPALPVSAQSTPPHTPYLVKNFNTCTLGSNPAGFFEANGIVYFSASTKAEGAELWRTDGTEEGTRMVADLTPGSESSNPGDFHILENYLYFLTSKDNSFSLHLWKLDLTSDETSLVSDISGSSSYAYLDSIVQLGDYLFYIYSGNLYRSDGTQAGTSIFLEQFYKNNELAIFNDKLIIIHLNRELQKYEIWDSDGTPSGSHLIKRFDPGEISKLTVVGNSFYFYKEESDSSINLWRSDGTSDGTAPVPDLPSISNDKILIKLPTGLLTKSTAGDLLLLNISNPEGTVISPQIIKSFPANGGVYSLQKAGNNTALFVVPSGDSISHIWRTDGTESGTFQITSTKQGENKGINQYSILNKTDRYVYFSDYSSPINNFYVSDGTPEGTVLLSGMDTNNTGASAFVQDKLIFTTDVKCKGREPRVASLSTGSTQLLKDIFVSDEDSYFYYNEVMTYNNRTMFFKNDENNQPELWSSDGTEEQTKLVYAFHQPLSISEYTSQFFIANGLLFLKIQNTFWRTDGTPEGTWQFLYNNENQIINFKFSPVVYKDKFYFIDGQSLRSFDGESKNSVEEVNFQGRTYAYKGPLSVNGWLYYFLENPKTYNYELFKSDGTPVGTSKVDLPIELSNNSMGAILFSSDKRLFFDYKNSLWVTDGTVPGTAKIFTFDYDQYDLETGSLPIVNENLYFITHDHSYCYYRLWVLPGGSTKVQKLLEFVDKEIWFLGAQSTKVYFIIHQQNSSIYQFWELDSSTSDMKKIMEESNYSYPVIWFDNIIFGKSDEETGNEIWINDQVTGQKRILADIYPGPYPLPSQSPKRQNYPLGLADGKLWISADDGVHGQELWAYDFLPIETYLTSVTR